MDIISAKAVDRKSPVVPHREENRIIPITVNRKVREKEITADARPLDSAVYNADA